MSNVGLFRRNERIKKTDDFKRLFKTGKKTTISGAKLFYAKNHADINRVGFSLPRSYGNAVQRNLSKRYSREVYRTFKAYLHTGYDMIILIYPGNDSFSKRYDQFHLLFKNAGLLKI